MSMRIVAQTVLLAYKNIVFMTSTNKMSQDDSVDHVEPIPGSSYRKASVAISASKAFDTFTLFPDLPTELRRLIWRYALPPADRVLTLGLTCPKRSDNWQWELHPLPCSEEGRSPWMDTGTLGACQESRVEYMAANPRTLPERNGGKIYYNPSTTWIHIVPCSHSASYLLLASAKGIHSRTPAIWFADLELLIIHASHSYSSFVSLPQAVKDLQTKLFMNVKEMLWIEKLVLKQLSQEPWAPLGVKAAEVMKRYRIRRALSGSQSRITGFNSLTDVFQDL